MPQPLIDLSDEDDSDGLSSNSIIELDARFNEGESPPPPPPLVRAPRDQTRARAWCLTSYAVLPPHTNVPDMRYSVGAWERCPNTGRCHWQFYIYYKNPRTFESVRLSFNGDHVERARGTPAENRTYCLKAPIDQFEHGEIPEQGKRTDITAFVALVTEGKSDIDILKNAPGHFLRYAKHVNTVRQVMATASPRFRDVSVYVYFGDTGTGKTRKVYTQEEDLYVIPARSTDFNAKIWLDGYNNETAILLDDYRGEYKYSLLLQLLDGYRRQWEIKGGFVWGTWSKVYITSDRPWTAWYPGTESRYLGQLKRRISTIEEMVALPAGEANAAV